MIHFHEIAYDWSPNKSETPESIPRNSFALLRAACKGRALILSSAETTDRADPPMRIRTIWNNSLSWNICRPKLRTSKACPKLCASYPFRAVIMFAFALGPLSVHALPKHALLGQTKRNQVWECRHWLRWKSNETQGTWGMASFWGLKTSCL